MQTQSETKTSNGVQKKKSGRGAHAIEDNNPSGIGGRIEMAENVVATIAGLAARETDGIHKMGRSQLVPFGTKDPKRGVEAEVGSKQAALDLDVIVEYGCDIRNMAQSLRKRIAEQVLTMTGREVVEVNINVVDVFLPDLGDDKRADEEPRVI